MLDLKTEICQLKSKLLKLDQGSNNEVTQKNIYIAQLERKIKAEEEMRKGDNTKNEKIIEELQNDIEVTL